MKKKSKKGSLYRKLVCSYVLFSLLVVLLFSVCLVIVSMLLSNGNLPGLVPYTLTDQESCEKAMPGIQNLKGWIEELDEEYQVRAVMGDKRTPQDSYMSRELFRLTSPDDTYSKEYVGFLNERTDEKGYYLVILGRTEMRLGTTILYGPDNRDTRWEKLFLAMFFGLFVIMCILMAQYLNRRIKRPLQYLTEGMERVRTGERDVQLSFQTEAEFAQIRDAFNVMSKSLETARREKEEAECRKNKMLLELSHDIRTPIATISSYAVALKQDMVCAEEQKKYYETIRSKAERVNLLADDMFTMLKMQSSEYELYRTKGDICEFLRRECVEYFGDAQDQGLSMEVDIPEESIWVKADYSLLKRVMGNLLSNAVKYNHTGKEIAVTLFVNHTQSGQGDRSSMAEADLNKRNRVVQIEVADDGNPVPEQLRDHLFDDFVRGDQARRTDGGTGLGLSIARAILRKHGGELSYQYKDGKNCFLAVLPVSMKV